MRLGAYVLTGGGLVAGALLAAPGTALAAWSAESAGSAMTARAAELPRGAEPEVRPGKHPSSVVVDWPAVSVVRGVRVETYRVIRVDARTGERSELSGSCRGLVSGTRCTDAGVPDGRWTYRVRAVLGDWTGSWSPAGEPILVDTTPEKPPVAKPPAQQPAGPAPEKPEKPANDEPEKPAKPETPGKPERPQKPEQAVPDKPVTPAPVTPAPEEPAAPEKPAQPESGADPGTPTGEEPPAA